MNTASDYAPVLSTIRPQVISKLLGQWNEIVKDLVHDVGKHLHTPPFVNGHPFHWLEEVTRPVLLQKTKSAQILIVSSMASGGKSTTGKILEKYGLLRMPRVTTRHQRPGERPGQDYEFVSREQFEKDRHNREFLYVEDGKIAVRKSTLDELLATGRPFYCEGDPLSFDVIRKLDEYRDLQLASFFICPDSLETAVNRLFQRIQTDILHGASEEECEILQDIDARTSKIPFHLRNSGKYFTQGIYHGYVVNETLEGLENKIVGLLA